MLISDNSSGYWIPILIILFGSYSWEYMVYIGFICCVICGQNEQIMKRQLMGIFIIVSIWASQSNIDLWNIFPNIGPPFVHAVQFSLSLPIHYHGANRSCVDAPYHRAQPHHPMPFVCMF